jgi:hypothetical protein
MIAQNLQGFGPGLRAAVLGVGIGLLHSLPKNSAFTLILPGNALLPTPTRL